MKNVLIVSPHFPPINAADHQRVRLSLPYFKDHGWTPHVLAVDPDFVEGVKDPLLEKTIPTDIEVTRVKALSTRYTRLLGIGNLPLRAYPFLKNTGNSILKNQKFDLVYFSTTMFISMALGPGWLRRHGVPYALDIQDLWLNDYYYSHSVAPPGGMFKYSIAYAAAKILEPHAIRHASHITCVSKAYAETLKTRYPELGHGRLTVLPFGAAVADFEILRKFPVAQSIFDPSDGCRHWVYVGRGGDDMSFALTAFFKAVENVRKKSPRLLDKLKIHFVGTSYAPERYAKKTIAPLAAKFFLQDMVEEHELRIPYFEGLRCLADADALIMPGSDDPSYSASKIYPYILANKPLLAIFHEKSDIVDIVGSAGTGCLVTFNKDSGLQGVAQAIEEAWLESDSLKTHSTNWSVVEKFSAASMAARLCTVFETATRYTKKIYGRMIKD